MSNDNALQPSSAAPETAGPVRSSPAKGGEIRLSFRYFYLVLKWGQEKRSAERLDADRKAYPVLTATHAPVLAAIWAALFLTLYYLLVAGFEGLAYLFS